MSCTNHPDVSAPLLLCAGCLRRFCHDCVARHEQFHYCLACHPRRKAEPGVPHTDAAPPARPTEPPEKTAPDAAPLRRAFAFFVDAALVGFALVFLLSQLNRPAAAMALIVGMPVVYEALFVQHMGQTIGKSLLGIRVVSADGGPVDDAQAWGRAVIKVAQLSCCGLAFLSAAFSRQRRALHDHAAGTRVVAAGEGVRSLSQG